MIRTNARVPKLGRHASGQAVVRLSGKDHYLGHFGTPTAQAQYDTLIAEWLSRGRTLPPADDAELSVNELVLAYLRQHVERHYRKNGRPTSEQHCIKAAVRLLKDAYGLTAVSNFGPMALKVVRQRMIDDKLSRRVINKQIARIKACFKWGTENELVPPSVFHGLQSVAGLKAGRTEARETDPVKPVPNAFVDAILPHVSPQVRAMIELQRLTGMRPGEVCQLRTCDIDVTGKVWIFLPATSFGILFVKFIPRGRTRSVHRESIRPQAHKTEHHGKRVQLCVGRLRRSRRYPTSATSGYIEDTGPKAQDILRPWLKPDLSAYLFSPAEAKAARADKLRQERQTPLWPSHVRHQLRKRKPTPKRPPKDHYTSVSYNQAIEYGIAKANREIDDDDLKIPDWHPNQLRHNAATVLRKEHGIELARIVLGHSTAFTTEIYAATATKPSPSWPRSDAACSSDETGNENFPRLRQPG